MTECWRYLGTRLAISPWSFAYLLIFALASFPNPTLKIGKGAWSYLYVLSQVVRSCGSQVLLMMALQWTDLAKEQLKANPWRQGNIRSKRKHSKHKHAPSLRPTKSQLVSFWNGLEQDYQLMASRIEWLIMEGHDLSTPNENWWPFSWLFLGTANYTNN